MTSLFLVDDFALQSCQPGSLVVTQHYMHAGTVAAVVETAKYPRAGTLLVAGLRPNRHYILQGAAKRFCRAGDDGAVAVELTLSGPALLLLSPVL